MVLDETAHPTVRWFNDALIRSTLSDEWVSARAGVANTCLWQWRRGRRPRVDMLDAALGALGYQLAIVDAETGEVVGP